MVGSLEQIAESPLISVLMPVYNGERFIAEAIESILRQTERRFELLVLDDGSNDRSAEIAEQFGRADDRVRTIRLTHAGLVATLNRGIELARGEVIARMDADDIAIETRFEKQLRHLVAHRRCVAVGGAITALLPNGQTQGEWPWPEHLEYRITKEPENIGMPHPGATIRASALRAVGGYRAGFKSAEDADLWRRLIEIGDIDNLAESVVLYRLHPDQVSNRENLQQQLFAEVAHAMFVARADGGEPNWDFDIPLTAERVAELAGLCKPWPAAIIHAALARYYFRQEQMEAFEKHFFAILEIYPAQLRCQATFDMFWKMIPSCLGQRRWEIPLRLIAANPGGIGSRAKRRVGLWVKHPISPGLFQAWIKWRRAVPGKQA